MLDPHFRRALRFVRPYAGALVPVVVLSLAGTGLNLTLPPHGRTSWPQSASSLVCSSQPQGTHKSTHGSR